MPIVGLVAGSGIIRPVSGQLPEAVPVAASLLNRAGRLAHLDALRAVAVLMVVASHAGWGGVVPGGAGVTIFFTISGFIITLIVLRERDATGGFALAGFYKRRFMKLAPPLLALIVLPTVIYSAFHPVDLTALGSQVFFFSNFSGAAGEAGVLPGSGVVWSLAIEEQFYILFSVVWIAAVRTTQWPRVLLGTALATIALSTVARLVLAGSPGADDRIYYGSDTRMDSIAFGLLAAVAYHLWLGRSTTVAKWTSRALGSDATLLGAIAILLLSAAIRDPWYQNTVRYTLQPLATCALILYGLTPGEGRLRTMFSVATRGRLITTIGLASYSIYLCHFVVISAMRPQIEMLPNTIVVPLLACIGIGVGVVAHRVVEEPVQRRAHRASTRLAPNIRGSG